MSFVYIFYIVDNLNHNLKVGAKKYLEVFKEIYILSIDCIELKESKISVTLTRV